MTTKQKTKAQIEKEKLEELTKEYKVKIEKIDINEDYYIFKIICNFCPKAYQRPRKGRFSVFDPIGQYKNILKELFSKEIDKILPELPFEGYCSIESSYFTRLPKKSTKKEQLLASKGIYRPLNRDVDNFDKTLFDCLNTFVYKDDGQIVSSVSEKFYSLKEDHSEYLIKIYRNLPEIKGRLTKEENLEWTNITDF